MSKPNESSPLSTFVANVASIVCCVCLAATYLFAGYAACAAQPTTRLLAQNTCSADASPYTYDQLVQLAVATRDYTVEGHDGLLADAKELLASRVVSAAQEASSEGSQKASAWTRVTNSVNLSSEDDSLQTMYAVASVSDAYGLDEDAMSHLEDCNALITKAVPVFMGIAIVALILAVMLRNNKKLLGRALSWGGTLVLTPLFFCGIWSIYNFDAFFAFFHEVLFPQGNWTFSESSLLISMLPEGFWMGMGALWLAVTATACIISIVLGGRMKRHAA